MLFQRWQRVPGDIVDRGGGQRIVSGVNSTITVSDVADNIPSGFVYFQLVDPSGGQYAITSVKRSDGTELLVGTDVWQTPYRPHMVPPQLNNLIHIFDCNSTGSYTVTYGPPSPRRPRRRWRPRT